jgi:Spy/CpxP family protein refolding chaperone
MKKIVMSSIAVALILMMAGANPAWAKQPNCPKMMKGHCMEMGYGPMGWIDKLDLTKPQMDQVDKILDQHKDEFEALHRKIDESRESLHAAVTADAFDEQKIRAASKTLAADMEEMAVLRGKTASQIRGVLTPEQIEKVNQLRAEHKEKMQLGKKCREMMMHDGPWN